MKKHWVYVQVQTRQGYAHQIPDVVVLMIKMFQYVWLQYPLPANVQAMHNVLLQSTKIAVWQAERMRIHATLRYFMP